MGSLDSEAAVMLVPGSVYGKSVGKGVVVVGGRMTKIVDMKEQDVEYSLLLFLLLRFLRASHAISACLL